MTDCHSNEGELENTSVEDSKVTAMPCHSEESSKEEHSSTEPCSDCLSACCHISVIEQFAYNPKIYIHLVNNSDNWPLVRQYKDSFLSENFRPPIFG